MSAHSATAGALVAPALFRRRPVALRSNRAGYSGEPVRSTHSPERH